MVSSHGTEGQIGDHRIEDAGNRAYQAEDESDYRIRGDYLELVSLLWEPTCD
jgi:hypothetical protein